MKKLKLNLDDLHVESFDTVAANAPRGTVEGASGMAWYSCAWGGCCGEYWPSDVCNDTGVDCTAGCYDHGATRIPCGHTIEGSCYVGGDCGGSGSCPPPDPTQADVCTTSENCDGLGCL
jgi:hypothetical protein